MDAGFCPKCGNARQEGMTFCGRCGYDFAATAAPPAPASVQGGVAGGLYELEQLRVKLIFGRLAGIAVGLFLWWTAIGPALKGDFLPTLGSLLAVVVGGFWVGQMVTLNYLRGR